MSVASKSTPTIWLLSADIMSQLGGGFRQQRWCEYYLRLGYSIRLFYVAGAMSVTWVDVHSEQELQTKRREWIAAAPPQAGVRDQRFARAARLLKHTFLPDLFYPSIIRLLFLINAMKKQVPGVTVLLCSSPPFSLAVVGAILKSWWGKKVVMALDMRDLWSLHSAFLGPKAHKRWIEHWVISKADDFTTVSVGLAERFKAVFNAEPQVVYNVATHARDTVPPLGAYDWTKWSPNLRHGSLKVLYTGSVPQGFYDLDAFVVAVEALAQKVPGLADRLQLVFVGAAGEMATKVANSRIGKDVFIFLPQTTHDKVAELQTAADVLLFLGYKAADNQGQVSIKLFEYFRRRKPILPAFINPGSDVDYLIKLYCGASPHFTSAQSLVEALATLLASGPGELPKASNSEADLTLLAEYEAAASRIVAKLQ